MVAALVCLDSTCWIVPVLQNFTPVVVRCILCNETIERGCGQVYLRDLGIIEGVAASCDHVKYRTEHVSFICKSTDDVN